jgi:TonB family protein
MSAGWAELETHVVNGAFPLHRCVGSSDHSGVFLTQSANHAPSAVALKLIPFVPDSAHTQLSRWRAAVNLSHPHLIRIFEAGECEVGGQHCLYALMEYAEQNLAQQLEQRALAEHEGREMLVPTLSALAYLHGNQFIQGQLKPSNILVVQDQLKLASDTVRAVGAPAIGLNAVSAYDAPEARDGNSSEAGDIWALGITLCEAFSRRRPSGLHGMGEVELPSDLPASLRETIARCLSRNPRDRPRVSELQSWLRGESEVAAATASPQPPAVPVPVPESAPQPKPRSAQTSAVRLVIRVELPSEEEPKAAIRQRSGRHALPLVLGAVALLALSWAGYRVFRADPSPAPTAKEAARDVKAHSPAPIAAPKIAPGEATSVEPEPAGTKSVEPGLQAAPDATKPPLNEAIPDVPRSALQTIRGTVRVSVRVIVDKDGAVLAATPDDPGPSRYFERLAIEASKKWTFAPANTEEQRLMLVRFNFTRAGTTASANPLQ